MDSRFDKLIENLPFDVVTGPCRQSILDDIPPDSIGTPVNVRIRFRHNDDVHKGIISIPKLGNVKASQKLRLINSDQTIMSFDFLMDTKATENSTKKPQKRVFRIFKSGICLSSQNDDDEYSYIPNTFENRNTTSSASKVDVINNKQNYNLKKNTLRQQFNGPVQASTLLLGKCKPGGCLDPPFGEERYAYEPFLINDENYQPKDLAGHSQVSLQAHKIQLRSVSPPKDCHHKNKLNDELPITYPSNLTCNEAKYKNNSLRSSLDTKKSVISNSNIYFQSYYKPSRSKETSITSKIEDGDKPKIIGIETCTGSEYTYITKSPSEDSVYRATGCPAELVLPIKTNLSPIESHIPSLQSNKECSMEMYSEQINTNGSKQNIPIFKDTEHRFQEYSVTSQSETTLPLPNSFVDNSSIKENLECKMNDIKLFANGIESHENNKNNVQNRFLNRQALDKKCSDKQSIIVIAPVKNLTETLNIDDTEYLPKLDDENQQNQTKMDESDLNNKEYYNNNYYLERKSEINTYMEELKGLEIDIKSSEHNSVREVENKSIKPTENPDIRSKSTNKNSNNINILAIKKEDSAFLKDNMSSEFGSKNAKESIISENNNNENHLYTKKVKDSTNEYDQTLSMNQVSNQNMLLKSLSHNLIQNIFPQEKLTLLTPPNLIVDSLYDTPQTSLLLFEEPIQNQKFKDNNSGVIKSNSNKERGNVDENNTEDDTNILKFKKLSDSTKKLSIEPIKKLSSSLKLQSNPLKLSDIIIDKFSGLFTSMIQEHDASLTKKYSTTSGLVPLKTITSPVINNTFGLLNNDETDKNRELSNKLSPDRETSDQVKTLETDSLQKEVIKTESSKSYDIISKSDVKESINPERNTETQLSHTFLKEYIDIPKDLQKRNDLNKSLIDNNDHQFNAFKTKNDTKINSEAEASTCNEISKKYNLESHQIKTKEGGTDRDVFEFDFALQSYVNNNEEKAFKTIDSTAILANVGRESVLKFNGKLRLDEDDIKLPIDHSMNIVVSIKKNTCASIETTSKQTHDILKQENIRGVVSPSYELQETISLIYEQNLIPVQNMLRALKEDVDILVRNQISIREMLKTKKSRPARLVYANKRCGCYRK